MWFFSCDGYVVLWFLIWCSFCNFRVWLEGVVSFIWVIYCRCVIGSCVLYVLVLRWSCVWICSLCSGGICCCSLVFCWCWFWVLNISRCWLCVFGGCVMFVCWMRFWGCWWVWLLSFGICWVCCGVWCWWCFVWMMFCFFGWWCVICWVVVKGCLICFVLMISCWSWLLMLFVGKLCVWWWVWGLMCCVWLILLSSLWWLFVSRLKIVDWWWWNGDVGWFV